MSELKNKTVVVTGGNSGIGLATAKAFHELEAKVLITGRREDALKKVSEKTEIRSFKSDQSVMADIDRLAEEIKTSYGKIDVLFLNAGIASFSPIESTTEGDFDNTFNTNVKGTFYVLQKLMPFLTDGASVIFLTSNITAMVMPNTAIYAASKSALLSIAKVAAKELAPKKIRVNVVSPGPTQTEIQSKFGMDEEALEAFKNQITNEVPLRRMAQPEEIAKLVVYLADNTSSSYITGADFFIDGGIAM